MVNHCGVPFAQADELRETSARCVRFSPHVTAYVAAVPGGFMALGWSAKDECAEAAGGLGTTR